MFIPINAVAYFYFWVSYNLYGSKTEPISEEYITCTTTVHHIITNDEYYNINDTIESVLIKDR